ncbi:MAG: DUF4332 domain-containing protein, partial [Candidatus Thorarchaeota archaeon]|nr:DUF4332 domain-containing protein [Candidatus Thorarchaeota archaeon]
MVSMDEDQFRSYLKKNKKSKSAIENIVEIVGEYEGYLLGEGIELSAAQIEDLEGFVLWIENALKEKANRRLWAVTIYYEYRNDEKLAKHAGSLRGKRIKTRPFKIGKFRGVNQHYIKQFEAAGIENVEQMIQRGSTPEKRVQLAKETGVPIESVLELVKLSNLTRLDGVKAIRARLYHD